MVILTKNAGLKHSVASHPCEGAGDRLRWRGPFIIWVPVSESEDVAHQTGFVKLQTTNYPFPRGPVPGTGLERGSLQTPRSSRLGLAANFEGVSVNTIYIPMLTPFLTPCSCFLLESHFSSCLYCKNSSTKRLYDKIYHYVLFNPTNPLKKFIILLYYEPPLCPMSRKSPPCCIITPPMIIQHNFSLPGIFYLCNYINIIITCKTEYVKIYS